MGTATDLHTDHPCAQPGCYSQPRWVLVDPQHEGEAGYDAIRANLTDYLLIVERVSRTFGADTFDTKEAAIAHRVRMEAASMGRPERPIGLSVLARSVPTPWGTAHHNRFQESSGKG